MFDWVLEVTGVAKEKWGSIRWSDYFQLFTTSRVVKVEIYWQSQFGVFVVVVGSHLQLLVEAYRDGENKGNLVEKGEEDEQKTISLGLVWN